MDVMKDGVFAFLLVMNDIKPFSGIFSFIIEEVPPSNFDVVHFLLRKDYFVRQRLQRYRFLMAENEMLSVLDI